MGKALYKFPLLLLLLAEKEKENRTLPFYTEGQRLVDDTRRVPVRWDYKLKLQKTAKKADRRPVHCPPPSVSLSSFLLPPLLVLSVFFSLWDTRV